MRFEARGKHPFFSKMLQEYLDAMHIDDAGLVLDMGCGTGLAARAIVHRPHFSGKVTGVDLSPHLIAAAERLAGEEGIAGQTEFQTGDAHSIDFPDGTFDAVIAHTLLSHVDGPYVLSEAGTASFWSSAIEAYRRLIPKAGVMTGEEADAWAAALRSDSDQGVFFGSSNYYAYVSRRS